MLGPFFDRGGRQLSPEVWERLTRENSYTVIAAEMFDESSVVVRTRWLGQDPEAHEPPQIFHSKAIGDGAVPEVLTATEAEAIAAHKGLCPLQGSGGVAC